MVQDTFFHLYLLFGQSNMAGRGRVGPQDQEAHPRVLALDKANEWLPAVDPIHFDKPAIAGVGPGLTFGQAMADRDPSVCVGLVPCAVGGSPIATWVPGGYWQQTDSHPYDDAIARTVVAMQEGLLKGILWHQGESDSSEADAPLYGERLAELIAALRSALRAPDVPFVAATLGDFVLAKNTWALTVNEVLMALPERVAHTACVEAAGLAHGGDDLHFSAEAARELGRRYAAAMIRLQETF
jgi:hypothetical protein